MVEISGYWLFVTAIVRVWLNRSYGNIQKLHGGPYSLTYCGRWHNRWNTYVCEQK